MDHLVARNQTTFIKGRQLADGVVVVVNEVVDYAKKMGGECTIFKVDFEKAYDLVDWGFLDYKFGRFGFSRKWREWIRARVFSGSLFVLVNVSPTKEINIRCGVKQGDSLAPFLYLLVAEGLGGLVRVAIKINRFVEFKLGSPQVEISHLQYADDTLLIGEATVGNLWAMKTVMRSLEIVSGQKVNFWKSCLMGVIVSDSFLEMAAKFLHCKIDELPFKYLGLLKILALFKNLLCEK